MRPGRIYLDNAATSCPKPAGVMEAMVRYARDLGVPARGGYAEVKETARLVQRCRERVCQFVNGERAENVVFMLNTTDAMNLAIHGVVRRALRERGGRKGVVHVVTSELDHNSALRPFNALVEGSGGRVEQTRVAVDPATGVLDAEDFRRAIRPETVLVATLHASNVTGAIQPVGEIGQVCRERGVLFLLDAAQSLGHVPVDVQGMSVDLLAFPGHKGLLGPTGTGGLYIRPGVERLMDTVREGGTGQGSELEAMPETLPERFEPGSHNTMGIIGLSEGVAWLMERGDAALRKHEAELIGVMMEGLASAPGVRVLGSAMAERVGVFSFTQETIEPQVFGRLLEERYGILSRSGLHCAPLAHGGIGTGARGATRLSIGPFTTRADVEAAVGAVKAIAAESLSAVK